MVRLAIVGRPNVGKSTLFNRLAGKRLAIVDDRPGVTRDRRFATGRLGDLALTLIDTAGFEDVGGEALEARMRRQTELAIGEAELVLFLIDAREGVVPLDRFFAEQLRRAGKPVVVVANKAEGRAGEGGILEAHAFGLGEPVAISAEHGEGLADLHAAVVAASGAFEVADEGEDAAEKPVRLAILGRPNAGKSTLVNALIGEDRLLTGPEAGITRDAISVSWTWQGQSVRLVDTAGLRRKSRVEAGLERLAVQDALRALTFAEVAVLTMDATCAFETQDLQIADLIAREGRAVVFVLAKWDLIDDPGPRLAALKERAAMMLPQVRGAPIIPLSAETGAGLGKLMPAVIKAHADWSARLSTPDLNAWLRLALEKHPPPAVEGRRVKPKYIAQTKARPPTFVLFANRAEALAESYRRYLVNSLREAFDLPGTPIRLTLRSGRNPYAEKSSDPTKAFQARRRRQRRASR